MEDEQKKKLYKEEKKKKGPFIKGYLLGQPIKKPQTTPKKQSTAYNIY